MSNPDLVRHLHEIIDANSATFAALTLETASLKAANTANGKAIAAMREANDAIAATFEAHEATLGAAQQTTLAALAMLETLTRVQ
jgi:hypothetical protein